MKLGMARAFIGIIVAEIETSVLGVGNLINKDVQQLNFDRMWVAIISLGVFSIAFTVVLKRIENWTTMPWLRKRRAGPMAVARVAETGPPAEGPAVVPLPQDRDVDCPDRHLRADPDGVAALHAPHVQGARLRRRCGSLHATYHQVFVDHTIWAPLWSSMVALVLGYLIAVGLGIPIGIAMGRWRAVEHTLDPYVSFLYALPHVAFVPIMVVWLGFELKFRLAYVVLSAIFPVIINTMAGVKNVDPELLDVGQELLRDRAPDGAHDRPSRGLAVHGGRRPAGVLRRRGSASSSPRCSRPRPGSAARSTTTPTTS